MLIQSLVAIERSVHSRQLFTFELQWKIIQLNAASNLNVIYFTYKVLAPTHIHTQIYIRSHIIRCVYLVVCIHCACVQVVAILFFFSSSSSLVFFFSVGASVRIILHICTVVRKIGSWSCAGAANAVHV